MFSGRSTVGPIMWQGFASSAPPCHTFVFGRVKMWQGLGTYSPAVCPHVEWSLTACFACSGVILPCTSLASVAIAAEIRNEYRYDHHCHAIACVYIDCCSTCGVATVARKGALRRHVVHTGARNRDLAYMRGLVISSIPSIARGRTRVERTEGRIESDDIPDRSGHLRVAHFTW